MGIPLQQSGGGSTTPLALPNGTTATTQTAGDNSTKLATTAYVDAEAPAPIAASGDWCMIPCDYWDATTAVSAVPGNTTVVYFGQFNLIQRVTFTKATVYVSISGTTGDKFYVGIYDKNYNLKAQATFTSTGAIGVYSVTISSTTLAPGRYFLAFAGSATVMGVYTNQPISQLGSVMVQNTIKLGFINNAVSGGNLPAILNSSGSFTASATVRPPCVLLEP